MLTVAIPLFSYLTCVRLNLHSFPTRRSSDLVWPLNLAVPPELRASEKLVQLPPKLTAALRSAEHTSELQSQASVVCRLLLATKNASNSTKAPPEAAFLLPETVTVTVCTPAAT